MTKYIYHYHAETIVGCEIYPMSGMINWAKPFDSDADYQELKNNIAKRVNDVRRRGGYAYSEDVLVKSLTCLHSKEE